MIKVLILGLCLFALSSFGQSLHDEVTKVFNFYPHQLKKEEQKALLPVLDGFFELVIKDKTKYLGPLREELKRNDNNPYFYFDGGLLLLEISKEKEDIQLVADALVKADLRDLPGDMYLKHLLNLSMKGANVLNATLHILDDTTFSAFIPQHVLSLPYGEGLMFILPRYDASLYIDSLIAKYNSIPSAEKKKTCINLFVYANSCQADAFLASQVRDNAQPQEIRDAISETLKSTKVVRKANPKKYAKLFDERLKILTRVSDEAIYELNANNMKMRNAFACPGG